MYLRKLYNQWIIREQSEHLISWGNNPLSHQLYKNILHILHIPNTHNENYILKKNRYIWRFFVFRKNCFCVSLQYWESPWFQMRLLLIGLNGSFWFSPQNKQHKSWDLLSPVLALVNNETIYLNKVKDLFVGQYIHL